MVRDLPVLDSDWRLLPKSRSTWVNSAKGWFGADITLGRRFLAGKASCYRFSFKGEDSEALEPMFGGSVPGTYFVSLRRNAGWSQIF